MNLDDLNSINGSLFSDADKSAAFSGIVCGSNGAPPPEGAGRAFMAGYSAAARWRAEAEEFQRKMSESGKTSAASRESKYGTAQPFHEQTSNQVRTRFDDSSNQATSYKLQAVNNKQQESLAPLAPPVPADEQQPERSSAVSPSASTPGLSSEPSHATPVLPVRQARAKKTSTAPAIPENLATPEFISAWGEWMEYRKNEMRKPLNEALAQRQLKNLSQFSSQVAVSAIKKSMSSGWMGLFPEKEVPQKRSSGWGVPSSTGQALSPLERQALEAEQAKNYVPML